MGTLFIKVIEISVVSSFLMLAVILIRFMLGKAPKWFMGVLWAIVALRLVFPLQIESKIGFMPDVGSKIESFILYDTTSADGASEVVNHNYEPNIEDEVTYVFESDDSLVSESDEVVKDYLPNEKVIVATDQGMGTNTIIWRRDLFIRLQMSWIFGILIILTYAVFSYISIRKKTSASIKHDSERDVFICDEIDTPFILGVFKPIIYLPSGLDDETTRNVLAHEKAHIKRLDYLRKQFGFLILAVHWFNPLVWVSYALFCKDIELACDERVIRHMSLDEKKSYANSLLLCSTHKRLVLVYPLAFGEVGVETRVKQVFNYRKPTFWLIMILIVVCAGLSSSFFTSASTNKDAGETGSNGEMSIVMTKEHFIQKWCEDFKGRNAQGIIEASTDEVQKILREEDLLDGIGKSATFGWSSPWPGMSTGLNSSCAILFLNDEKTEAEIVYSATDSEPHVYLWKELIKIAKDDNGDYKVVSEELIRYEDIETANKYNEVWSINSIALNALDYTENGLGEALNNNAMNSTGNKYSDLFDPLKSARYLLNLSEDEEKVEVLAAESKEYGSFVLIKFNDVDYHMSVGMVQPWGKDGIYVPVKYLQPAETLIGVFEGENEYITDENEFKELPNVNGNEVKWIDLN